MKCRCCHNLLTSQASCSICKEATDEVLRLVEGGNTVDELYDGNQEEDLKTVSQQSIRLIRKAQTLLEREMSFLEEYDGDKTREILKLASASQKSLQEAIKLEKNLRDHASSLSQDEKIDLMIKFFKRIPPEKQQKVAQTLIRIINDAKRAISRF